MKDVITGLDIGTSKICAAVADKTPDGEILIRGVGIADARGINKGFVSNLDKLVDSISKAVESAQEKSGLKTHNVITNISGASVNGRVSEGSIPLSRRGREVTKSDIKKVIEITKDISLSLERDFLYCLPQEFMVDDSEEVENPLGLFGVRLRVKLYVITALATHIQNISKAVSYAGYELLDIVPTAIAMASTILSDEERNNGVAVIDVGGGITELAIFNGGILRFFDSVNVGGMDLTACLSAHFKMPFENAEMIKRKNGSIAEEDMRSQKQSIFDIGDRHIMVSNDVMNRLLKERFDEIFYILKERLTSSGYFEPLIPSLVMTGGCALLNGVLESFESRFGIPAKLGHINEVTGDPSLFWNPIYSAAISLAKYGLTKYARHRTKPFKYNFFLTDIFFKLRELLEEYF